MAQEFSVMVEAVGASDDDRAEDLVDVLAGHAGVVHLGGDRWGARFTVEAADASVAALRAWAAWHEACEAARLPAGPVVRLDVTAAADLDRAALGT